MRCTVESWDDIYIYVREKESGREHQIDYSATEFRYLKKMLRKGTQLNTIKNKTNNQKPNTKYPKLIIIEPDFLVDISSIAACFSECGHHPLTYTYNRLKPRANSYSTLLGNFAGSALDDIINNGNDCSLAVSLRNNFKEKALEYCTCNNFNGKRFKEDAETQYNNIKEAVAELFTNDYERKNAILEPSFVCEKLGLNGRVDLMTSDLRLLVEQKSGRNGFVEQGGTGFLESHYAQLLLYDAVLKNNFDKGRNPDIRLLYSKYPADNGLIKVPDESRLLAETIHLRNKIVAIEMHIADNGFESVIDHISPNTLNERNTDTASFHRFQFPEMERIISPLHQLSSLERAYFCRMMTFVYKEQLISKLGGRENVEYCAADQWQMPIEAKIEAGEIYTGLKIKGLEQSNGNNYDIITLSVPQHGVDFLPNFRCGDMVFLYGYSDTPDVRRSILYKGYLKELHAQEITVALINGLHNPDLLSDGQYAVEHASSDMATGSSVRSLYRFITSNQHFKSLLLGQRTPERDLSQTLSRSYNPYYDDILLRAKQAKDYFLLIGPPGTGKTSMALRYIVEENDSDILLMSYTNRAVDEICAMLEEAGKDYLRIGNEYSCAPRFRHRLISKVVERIPRLDVLKQQIKDTRIIVGTTSTMQSRPFIFEIKHFSLAVIDEAGQILEPDIVGLLSENIDRFILIGDHKQLPAVVQQEEHESAVKEPVLQDICLDNCRNSLFERLLRIEYKAGRKDFVGVLHRQGRMHPDIADFPNRLFYKREQLLPVPLPHQQETSLGYTQPSEDSLDDILKSHRMIFIPSHNRNSEGMSDKVNVDEARIVCDILQRIRRFYGDRFDANKTAGVIVPYRNQIAIIRKELEKTGDSALSGISIDTVERYQGSQRDVIIYSFTAQKPYQMNFLTASCFIEDNQVIDRKLNVAITRARKQLIMTGNEQLLRTNPVFNMLIDASHNILIP